MTKASHTAWIALIIGDKRLRGSGIGTRIMAHLERLIANTGVKRIEIGVFEYNERALCFFRGLGYKEFARRPERVWWQGRMWSEFRLLKVL